MGMSFDYVAVVLAGSFAALAALGIQQLYTASKSRNRKINMRNAVVAILATSAFLRSFYFTKVAIPTTWDDGLMMSLFIIPLWMQGLAISLLVVFYASTVYYNSSWRDWPLILCLCFNLIMLILDVSIATSVAGAETEEDTARLMLTYCCASVVEDILLAVLLIIYGSQFKTLAVDNHGHGNVLATWSERSITVFDAMNWLLTFSMVFRAVLTLTFYLTPLNGVTSVVYNGRHPVTSVLVLVFFLFAELLPSLCVFIMLFKLDVKSEKYGSGSNPVHYRVVSSSDGTTVADGYNPLSARLLSAEDKKIRVILSEEDAEEATYQPAARHQRNFLGEDVGSPPDPHRYPSVSSVGATQHQHQAITSTGDVHGNLDTKSVFRGAFSPDEKSLVDDLMARGDDMGHGPREGSREHSGSSSGMPGTSPGLLFQQGPGRAPIPSFLRRTPSPGALHPQPIKIKAAASPSTYSFHEQESPSLQEESFFQAMSESEEVQSSQGQAAAQGQGDGAKDAPDKYGDFISPRDILLKAKSRK